MNFSFISEHHDLEKTKKSLLAASLFTIVVTNASISQDDLNFFGVRIGIDQSQIISLGRLVVLVLLVIFILHSISAFFNELLALIDKYNEEWANQSKAEIAKTEMEIYDPNTFHHQENYEPEPWDADFYSARQKRQAKRDRLSFIFAAFEFLKSLLLNYALSVGAAISSLFYPSALIKLAALLT